MNNSETSISEKETMPHHIAEQTTMESPKKKQLKHFGRYTQHSAQPKLHIPLGTPQG